jgi:hypothetical protein
VPTVNEYSAISRSGCILYLAGKNNDLVDDPGSLVLQELLNDVVTDDTSPNDGEVCVSGHELTRLSCVCVILGPSVLYPLLFILFLIHLLSHPLRHAYEAALVGDGNLLVI